MQTVPMLHEEQSSGTGKLGRHVPFRQTTGVETGRVLADVEFVHADLTADETAMLEAYLPGATAALRQSVGEETDGRRPYEWRPEQGDCRVVFCPMGGGVKLYEGAAEVRRAAFRATAKGGVLTVYVRLHDLAPDAAPPILRALGEAVDYEIVMSRISGATAGASAEGGLFDQPKGGGPVRAEVGDLVVGAYSDGTEAVGRVVEIRKTGILLETIPGEGLDDGGGEIDRNVAPSSVVAAHPVCGPRGGSADGSVRRINQRITGGAKGLDWGHVLDALLDAADRGLIERGPEGWPLTSEVVQLAVERAGGKPDDALPPEAGSVSGAEA